MMPGMFLGDIWPDGGCMLSAAVSRRPASWASFARALFRAAAACCLSRKSANAGQATVSYVQQQARVMPLLHFPIPCCAWPLAALIAWTHLLTLLCLLLTVFWGSCPTNSGATRGQFMLLMQHKAPKQLIGHSFSKTGICSSCCCVQKSTREQYVLFTVPAFKLQYSLSSCRCVC